MLALTWVSCPLGRAQSQKFSYDVLSDLDPLLLSGIELPNGREMF